MASQKESQQVEVSEMTSFGMSRLTLESITNGTARDFRILRLTLLLGSIIVLLSTRRLVLISPGSLL
jgi:hypothetical protein